MLGAYEKAYGQLNAAQKRAVDTIEGPVLVIAGPGTGKTQLLSTRVASILLQTDTEPTNILCLTFTDSAVATLRDRLSSIIGKAAYDVTISTYHAFGSELIRRYPEHFMNDADLRPADDLAIDSTLRTILEHLPYSNPLRHDIFLRDIKTFMSDAKRALLTPEAIQQIADDNERFINAATKLIQQTIPNFARLDKTVAGSFEKLLVGSGALPDTMKATHVLSLKVLWLQTLEQAVSDFKASGKTTALTKWKNNWLTKDEQGLFVANGADQARKLRAAATIYERYLEALNKSGLYDYDDMILRAIRGLEDHPDLRYSLQERYLYVLLDEFQDTNAAQLRLVELLSDSPVHEGRPNVLAVGDDDQAIYAFQGANYSHMLDFYHRYKNVSVIPLTENYRSTKNILHIANEVVTQIETRLHEHFPGLDKTIQAANKTQPATSVTARYEFKTDLAQNAWVATKIKELIDKGVPGNAIAVLSPKHEYLEALVPFLHHEDLPIHYDKREDVLEDPSVHELITMSRLVVALAERDLAHTDRLWSEVISFSYWGLATELIWQLSWEAADAKRSWTDVLSHHTETKAIALFFIRLSQLVQAEPLERMLDWLIGITELAIKGSTPYSFRSPFYEHYFGPVVTQQADAESYWQLLSNLTVVRQHIREYKNTESNALSLADFIEFVAAHQAANIKIVNTNPYQEASDAVELITVYRAKGQEFRAVFLIGCIDEIWGSKARNVGSRLSLPANLQYIRYAGTTEDERLRLLYVALTRAKTELYLTSYTTTYTGRLTTRLKYLDESHDETGKLISPLLPKGSQLVQEADTTPPVLEELAVYWQHRHYRAITQRALQDLMRPRLEQFQLSPTELNCFTDVTVDGPATFFTQSLLRFPTAPTPGGQYGSTIHDTLEWIHLFNKNQRTLPTTKATLEYFKHTLAQKRLTKDQYNLLLDRASAALPLYLTQRKQTITPQNYAEYSFRSEGVFIGSAHLTGKIDKLIVNPKAKTVTIIDFKTGRSYQRWAKEIKLHAYRQQLYFYKLLVEHSHTFAGYIVEDAYLEFVEPDETGMIRELHLKFEQEPEQQLQKLIVAVWQHIMELKLPGVGAYSQDLHGIEAFQHDLIVGKT